MNMLLLKKNWIYIVPMDIWISAEYEKVRLLFVQSRYQGGGVYIGDMHAMQGDGEIAGHTTDVVL